MTETTNDPKLQKTHVCLERKQYDNIPEERNQPEEGQISSDQTRKTTVDFIFYFLWTGTVNKYSLCKSTDGKNCGKFPSRHLVERNTKNN